MMWLNIHEERRNHTHSFLSAEITLDENINSHHAVLQQSNTPFLFHEQETGESWLKLDVSLLLSEEEKHAKQDDRDTRKEDEAVRLLLHQL